MTTQAPVNTDVSSAWMIPGVFIKLDFSGNGAGLNNLQQRALLVGYATSSGTAPINTPVQVTGQSQANQLGGRGSELARMFAAFTSQVGGGQADVFFLPIAQPSAGTASTYLIALNGTAAAQDSIDVQICGYQCSTLVASGDTPTVIATNLAASINAMKDAPVTAAASTGTVTLTYRHTAITGEDLPLIVNIPNGTASGVKASPGALTYATDATSTGAITISAGGTTYSYTVTSADTADTTATGVAAIINGEAGPLTATAASGVVTLYYATHRPVRRITASMGTVTGTTVSSAVGTTGAGAPVLTTALAVLAAQSAFGTWVTSFNDEASLGAMSSHIETYANGLYQKDQFLWAASCAPLATAGAIPAGTSPALTASLRYTFGWCPDAPQQAYELAARRAAMVCVSSYKPQNWDGAPLVSQTATVPLGLPHRADRASPSDINSAMRSYFMEAYAVDEQAGQLVVVRGRTTIDDPDQRKWDPGLGQTAAFIRYDMGVFLRTRFKQKNIKSAGTPRTPNTITTDDVADAIIERLFSYDDIDYLDGADELKKAVRDNINALSPSRIDAYIPFRVPVPLHSLAPVLGLV